MDIKEVNIHLQSKVASSSPLSVADILSAISDEKSLTIFKYIYNSKGNDSETLLDHLNLTTKQYYSRLSKITNAGLVKRKQGKYFITKLGKVVYSAQKTIESSIGYYWILKAIDSIEFSDDGISEEYNIKLADELIDNQKIKEIIFTKGI